MQDDLEPVAASEPLEKSEPIVTEPTNVSTAPEQNETDNVASTVPPVNDSPDKPQAKKSSNALLLILLMLLLVVAAAYWFVKYGNNTKQSTATTPTITSSNKQKVTDQPVTDPLLAKFINPQTGESWLSQPQKLSNQKFYKDDDPQNLPNYYEVGKHGPNTIIMSELMVLGDEIRLYEKSPSGVVSLIAHPDGEAVYSQDIDKSVQETTATTVKVDMTTHYDSLTLPRSIDIGQGYSLGKPAFTNLGDLVKPNNEPTAPKQTTIKTLGKSRIVKAETSYVDTKLTSISYNLVTPINTAITLTYEPLETDLNGYSWQTGGSPSSDKLDAMTRGCGSLFSAVTRSDASTDADFQAVGKSKSGQIVYEVKDSKNPLIQKAYKEFSDFTKGTTELYANITLPDFIKEHAVVFYKDRYGQWLVYAREQLRPQGGCAKPVVYLYPEQPQQVNVRVGANITKSDPQYNAQSGWSVLAQPSGQLSTNGLPYDSLFWEGQGFGAYPATTQGTIVPHHQALATIRQQLSQQGLNQKEANDFVAYWQDKLPNNSYVRLTWLDTSAMNRLAPLAISPKPNTVIRVFLDFSGLDQPIHLPAQHFTSVPRQGFTVVEWGGLAATGLK